jgi:hypothetical protein
VAATAAANRGPTVVRPVALPSGQCIQLNLVTVNQSCPVGINVSRSVRFDVTAQTTRSNLRWRQSAQSGDLLTPSDGAIASSGTTSTVIGDLVLGGSLVIEVADGTEVLLRFTLQHQ